MDKIKISLPSLQRFDEEGQAVVCRCGCASRQGVGRHLR